jgi:3-hydroxybutyryl-CoA dehydrogenase
MIEEVVILAEPWQMKYLRSQQVEPEEFDPNDETDYPFIYWIEEPEEFLEYPEVDVWMDLRSNAGSRDRYLEEIPENVLLIVHSVTNTLEEWNHSNVARINAWKGFLDRPVVEASIKEEATKEFLDLTWALFGKKTETVQDVPGLVTARVLAMIINEAYRAKEEGVSGPEQMDLAMKLGTNYPKGPFEWAREIGTGRIRELLEVLSLEDPLYAPANSLL